MAKVVLATGNQGKLKEIQAILAEQHWQIIPQHEFDTPEAIEDGLSFVENAIIKARNACAHTGLPAISDDSGLEVAALKGAPGIYSARFGGEQANDEDNIAKLLKELADVPDEERHARFRCVMVYMRHETDPSPVICEGSWSGTIMHERQGLNGFGYDPVFYVPTHKCSSAALSAAQKNTLSHRGIALTKLSQKLNNL